MTIKSEGDIQGIVQETATLGDSVPTTKAGSADGRPAVAAEIMRLKRVMGVSGEGSLDEASPAGDAVAASNKISVTRSEPDSSPSSANKGFSWTFSLCVLAAVLVAALRTPQGQAVAERLGLLKKQDAWSKMSVDGTGGFFERILECPLVEECLAVLGAAGGAGRIEETPTKPQNVKLVASAVKPSVSAVQWVKPPEPADVGQWSHKPRTDFEGFPQEPPMSVSANQTFSALADMLESAGESEIAGKLRGTTRSTEAAAPPASETELNAMDDLGLTACEEESPEVAALRAALAEDEPVEQEVCDLVPSTEVQKSLIDDEAPTFHIQKSLIDTNDDSDGDF